MSISLIKSPSCSTTSSSFLAPATGALERASDGGGGAAGADGWKKGQRNVLKDACRRSLCTVRIGWVRFNPAFFLSAIAALIFASAAAAAAALSTGGVELLGLFVALSLAAGAGLLLDTSRAVPSTRETLRTGSSATLAGAPWSKRRLRGLESLIFT